MKKNRIFTSLVAAILFAAVFTVHGYTQDEGDNQGFEAAEEAVLEEPESPSEDATPGPGDEEDVDSTEKEKPEKKKGTIKSVRINWSIVPGAKGYRIQVKDAYGRTRIDGRTNETFYEISLDPGTYKARIGSINKFGKVETWSEWSRIIIRESRKKRNIAVETYGPKIGIGYGVLHVLPTWDLVYKNNYTALMANIRFGFFNIKSAARYGFFKHTGIELEFTYGEFLGKSSIFRVESDLETMLVGGNFFFRTHFQAPVNLILRGGSGLALTNLKYARYYVGNPVYTNYKVDEANRRSRDIYGKGGLSLEFMLHQKRLYLEVGADFYHIFYTDKYFMAMRYYTLISAKI